MKWIFVIAAVAASAHADKSKWTIRGGGTGPTGTTGQVSTTMIEEPASKDQVQVRCEHPPKDKLSVATPCKGVSLVLKSGEKVVESGELNPRGEIIFEKLSPSLTYTLELRLTGSNTYNRLDGVKGGRVYTFEYGNLK